ncbi:MAG: nucleotidyl transferase AbiEii/AbiGii toxin family protein [Pirellulales bacterium]
MIAYEQKLNADRRWAFEEGGMHFERESAVHKTLTKLAARLDDLGIPYAIAGGMALFFHGYRRFTEDIDVVVTADDLKRIHEELEGRGYVPVFAGSKNLRDTEHGVRIEFLVTGQFPGDGLPKPVAFPNPAEKQTVIESARFVPLETLIEMKLASGITSPRRIRDLSDVQEVIAAMSLDDKFAERLDPYVREKYLELWRAVRDDPNPEP